MAKQTHLTKLDDVVDALGGARAVRELVGAKPTTFSNWRTAGSFPSRYLAIMSHQLAKRGYSAPSSLWRQAE